MTMPPVEVCRLDIHWWHEFLLTSLGRHPANTAVITQTLSLPTGNWLDRGRQSGQVAVDLSVP